MKYDTLLDPDPHALEADPDPDPPKNADPGSGSGSSTLLICDTVLLTHTLHILHLMLTLQHVR